MKIKTVILLMLAAALWACKDKPENSSAKLKNEANLETTDAKYNSLHLQFSNPIVLDSSDWVIYPLPLKDYKESEKGFSSSSCDRGDTFWNVAFYNTKTKQRKLLSEEATKMRINWINAKNESATPYRQEITV